MRGWFLSLLVVVLVGSVNFFGKFCSPFGGAISFFRPKKLGSEICSNSLEGTSNRYEPQQQHRHGLRVSHRYILISCSPDTSPP